MNILDNTMEFTADMIPQKSTDAISERENKKGAIKMAKITNLIKINNYKLKEHANPRRFPQQK